MDDFAAELEDADEDDSARVKGGRASGDNCSTPDCSTPDCSLPDCSLPDCGDWGCSGPSCDGPDCGDCGSCSIGMMGILVFGTLSTVPAPRERVTVPGRLGLRAIRGYQRWLSPRLRAHCRYTPSCSQYGAHAVSRYGLLDGSRLTAARISRCTHAVPCGTHDPVP